MTFDVKPLPFDPKKIKGMSEKLLVSHYDNNYTGAVKRLNAIVEQLLAHVMNSDLITKIRPDVGNAAPLPSPCGFAAGPPRPPMPREFAPV